MTRTDRTPFLLDAATFGLAAMTAALGVWTLIAGPTDPLPVHWNASGEADRWGGREMIGWMLVGLGALTAVLGGGIGLAIRRSDDAARRRALWFAQLVVVLTLPAVALLAAAASLTRTTDIGGAAPFALMSLVILTIGAFIGRVGPNPFVGVRTPWAYKSRLAWERSNRLAGRLFFLLGLAGLVAAPFAPQPLALYALLSGIVIAAVWSVVESWRVWRTDPERQPF